MRLDKFLVVPFRAGGRDWSGCDCYGLVRLFLRELAGARLPAYAGVRGGDDDDEARNIALALDGRAWLPVPPQEARQFDCLLFSLPRLGHKASENHIGVITDERARTVLHTAPDIGASVVRFDHPSIRTRIKGFYRHASLAAP